MKNRLLRACVLLLPIVFLASAVASEIDGHVPRIDTRLIEPDYRIAEDGPAFQAMDPTGRLWAVWSYDNGIEKDLAISFELGRTWVTPELVGAQNGMADLDPRIAFTKQGVPVIVWWQQGIDDPDVARVMVSYYVDGSWSAPRQVNPMGSRAHSPSAFPNPHAESGLSIGYVNDAGGVDSAPIDGQPDARPTDPNGGAEGPEPMPTFIRHPDDGDDHYKRGR